MDGWWSEIDRDVRAILEGSGPMSPRDIARQLRLSEGAVASVLAMLVQEGKPSAGRWHRRSRCNRGACSG